MASIGMQLPSTATTDARDNAPVAGPVYLLDGTTKVVDNSSDMWDGNIDNAIVIDQFQKYYAANVLTGTASDGTGSLSALGLLQPSRHRAILPCRRYLDSGRNHSPPKPDSLIRTQRHAHGP